MFENVREDRLRALYVLAITAGLREGELLGLRWEDVNLERELLQVRRQLTRTRDGLSFTAPKRGKARVVRLTDMAIAALEAHRIAQNEERTRAGSLWQETGLVFTSTLGTKPPSKKTNPVRVIDKAFKRLDAWAIECALTGWPRGEEGAVIDLVGIEPDDVAGAHVVEACGA